jgi:hypothetical protein
MVPSVCRSCSAGYPCPDFIRYFSNLPALEYPVRFRPVDYHPTFLFISLIFLRRAGKNPEQMVRDKKLSFDQA